MAALIADGQFKTRRPLASHHVMVIEVDGTQLLFMAVQYAKERRQFGRPIAKFQAVQHMLANMRMRLEAARMALYRVGWIKEQGESAMMEASVAKLFISEHGLQCANDAVQIHGGYGYMREYIVEAGYRDAKLGTIGEGTSEVQRMIIARQLLDLRGVVR